MYIHQCSRGEIPDQALDSFDINRSGRIVNEQGSAMGADAWIVVGDHPPQMDRIGARSLFAGETVRLARRGERGQLVREFLCGLGMCRRSRKQETCKEKTCKQESFQYIQGPEADRQEADLRSLLPAKAGRVLHPNAPLSALSNRN